MRKHIDSWLLGCWIGGLDPNTQPKHLAIFKSFSFLFVLIMPELVIRQCMGSPPARPFLQHRDQKYLDPMLSPSQYPCMHAVCQSHSPSNVYSRTRHFSEVLNQMSTDWDQYVWLQWSRWSWHFNLDQGQVDLSPIRCPWIVFFLNEEFPKPSRGFWKIVKSLVGQLEGEKSGGKNYRLARS